MAHYTYQPRELQIPAWERKCTLLILFCGPTDGEVSSVKYLQHWEVLQEVGTPQVILCSSRYYGVPIFPLKPSLLYEAKGKSEQNIKEAF